MIEPVKVALLPSMLQQLELFFGLPTSVFVFATIGAATALRWVPRMGKKDLAIYFGSGVAVAVIVTGLLITLGGLPAAAAGFMAAAIAFGAPWLVPGAIQRAPQLIEDFLRSWFRAPKASDPDHIDKERHP